MFKAVRDALSRYLRPGTYSLDDLYPEDDLKVSIQHYLLDNLSRDWLSRARIYGGESARISGSVDVDQNGNRTFRNVEIRPYDSDFQFGRSNKPFGFQSIANFWRDHIDPYGTGRDFDLNCRGTGKVHHPFSDEDLARALAPFGPYAQPTHWSVPREVPLPYFRTWQGADVESATPPAAQFANAGD